MLKNMKIGVRMGLGFALVLLILLATLAVSAQRMGLLSAQINSIVAEEFPKTVVANSIMMSPKLNASALNGLYLSLSSTSGAM